MLHLPHQWRGLPEHQSGRRHKAERRVKLLQIEKPPCDQWTGGVGLCEGHSCLGEKALELFLAGWSASKSGRDQGRVLARLRGAQFSQRLCEEEGLAAKTKRGGGGRERREKARGKIGRAGDRREVPLVASLELLGAERHNSKEGMA